MKSVFEDTHVVESYFERLLDKPVENYAAYMSTKALDELAIQLVDYRMKHHLNQTDLAQKLGISQPMISQYESGTNNITVKRLCEICEKIGVRVQLHYEDANSPVARDSYDPFRFDTEEKGQLDIA